MKEIPILMSTPMVQAILAGTKTETRRIIKPRTQEDFALLVNMHAGINVEQAQRELLRCSNRYGEPGDLLWVREKFCTMDASDNGFSYAGDYGPEPVDWNWKPSIHMPKTAARIWLLNESVNIELLHDITESGAIAEGVEPLNEGFKSYEVEGCGFYGPNKAVDSYKSLWWKINGRESWAANPWVWVLKFKVLSIIGKL